MPEEKFTMCGYCQGLGLVYRSMFDRAGRRIADEPQLDTCEYCGGTGVCIDGHKLRPAESRSSILRRQEGL
jgi:hypothetical protein